MQTQPINQEEYETDMKYIPIFFDWIEVTRALSAQEKGRLIDALVLYARGDDWEDLIKGNERFVFPCFQAQIDRATEKQDEIADIRRECGKLGGRPRKNQMVSGENQKNQMVFEKSKKTYNNNNNKNKYENENENNNNHHHDDDAREDEFENPYGGKDGDRPRFDTVQAYANNNLNALGVRAMEELNDFVASTSEEVVRHAIDNALDSGVRTWAYVRAILNKYEDAGIKTAGDAKAFDDKRKRPEDAPAKPTQEDDDLRPRPVMPNPADVERIYDDNHLVIGWKILRTGETMMLSDYSKMTFGEQERFWDSKHIRWTNELFWRT